MTGGGACGKSRSFRAALGKPGPKLSPRDESPVGKNRGGTPTGERARKRRAAQAAFLRGASRTPLACGHQPNASAGVPLPFYWRMILVRKPQLHFSGSCVPEASRKEAFRRRNSFHRSLRLLRCSVVVVGKTRARKKRAAGTDNLMLRPSI